MYRLFSPPVTDLAPLHSPTMDRVRDSINIRLNYVRTRKWVYGTTINSNHVLLRLCMALSQYVKPESDTYRMVRDNLYGVCSALRITSDYSKGSLHSDCLYTDKCIIMSTDYSTVALPNRWQEYRPVRCLTHPDTSMRVRLPYHTKSTLKEGISAIGIDIPMFGYMFQQWSIMNNGKAELAREPLATFITKHILPGMIYEQLDIAIRNRLQYPNVADIPVDPKSNTITKTYEKESDIIARRMLTLLQTSRRSYKRLLMSIPMFGSDNYLNAVDPSIYSLNPYSYWAQLVVYVDWLCPMTKFVITDQKQVTDIERILIRVKRYVESSGTLNHIPGEIAIEFLEKYNACFAKWVTKR